VKELCVLSVQHGMELPLCFVAYCHFLPGHIRQARDLADFLLPMLAFDPSERATAAEALQHPWLTGSQQQHSSRDRQEAAAAAGHSSRHSSRHGSEHGSRRSSKSDRADGDRQEPSGRKASGSKRSSRPPSFGRSRSRTRSKSRGVDKRAR